MRRRGRTAWKSVPIYEEGREKRTVMNYIIFNLEWNQGNAATEATVENLPFEIIEIGAVRLNDAGAMLGKFSRLIKPAVYHEMHQITGRLLHLRMQELEKGTPFVPAAKSFLAWCGEEEYRFCTWGSSDLTELQRNMKYYDMPSLSKGPFAFLDVQKLFSIAYEDGKSRRALEHAVDYLQLKKDTSFHRAMGDAWYTAEILKRILAEKPDVLKNVSYDVFRLPADRKSEIRVRFDNYEKYISREFAGRTEAFGDREVASSKCYLCHRNLRKKIRWFTSNGKNYYCLAYCEKHGYLQGKIRLRKSEEGKYYVVKTTKLISPEKAETLRARKEHSAQRAKYTREEQEIGKQAKENRETDKRVTANRKED